MENATKNKNKVTIAKPKNLTETEVEQLFPLIDKFVIRSVSRNNKKSIQVLADEMTENAWRKFQSTFNGL